MRFAGYGFLPYLDPFLKCQRFMNLAVHQGEQQSDTELFLWVVPLFILYITCWSGRKEKNCESGGGMGKIDQSSFI